MKTFLPTLITILLSACSSDHTPANDNSKLNSTTKVNLTVSSPTNSVAQIQVDHLEMLIFETYPIQINVLVKGHFLDNCTTIADIIAEEPKANVFAFQISIARQTKHKCEQRNEPFEEIIPLDIEGLKAGIYAVTVNGITDTFELGIDNPVIHPPTKG
jgi:inhibitor of cysteine peptidase